VKRFVIALALTAALVAPQASARENRVVKCSTSNARSADSPGGPALIANVARSMTPIDLNAVQMTDKKLTRSVVVEGLFVRRTETNTVEVLARLVNCTKKPLKIDARSSFLDVSQFPTEPTSAWRTIFIPALATGVYQEKSLSRDEVKYYLIELKSAS
jgi:hypothetical protein